jgi:hypothetical protein
MAAQAAPGGAPLDPLAPAVAAAPRPVLAGLSIDTFRQRSNILEGRLRALLPEYTLLYGCYEDVRNLAIPNQGPGGGNMIVDDLAADVLEAHIDAAFAGVMDIIEQICEVNAASNNNINNNNNQGGGKRTTRKKNMSMTNLQKLVSKHRVTRSGSKKEVAERLWKLHHHTMSLNELKKIEDFLQLPPSKRYKGQRFYVRDNGNRLTRVPV